MEKGKRQEISHRYVTGFACKACDKISAAEPCNLEVTSVECGRGKRKITVDNNYLGTSFYN